MLFFMDSLTCFCRLTFYIFFGVVVVMFCVYYLIYIGCTPSCQHFLIHALVVYQKKKKSGIKASMIS